ANGEITYDRTRVAALASPIAGRVWRVEVEVGKAVKKGDVLALVDAAEVGKAKAEFLLALTQAGLKSRTFQAMKAPHQRGAIPEAKYREADAALHQAQVRLVAARQALANLGLLIQAEDVQGLAPEEIGERLQFLGLETIARTLKAEKTATANLLPVKAPRDGVVIVRRASGGQEADPSTTPFLLSRPSPRS